MSQGRVIDNLLNLLRELEDDSGKDYVNGYTENQDPVYESVSDNSSKRKGSNRKHSEGIDFLGRKIAGWGGKDKFIFAVIALLIVGSLYWWYHPALSLYSGDFWVFICVCICIPVYVLFKARSYVNERGIGKSPVNNTKAKRFKKLSYIPIAVIVIGLVGALLSLPIIPGNAHKYANILQTSQNNFAEDIKEVNYNEIPVIDRSSAVLLGNRVMGAIPEYVSQFEVSPLYSQINYKGTPVRVSPLVYADLFKWFTNREQGIPAYVKVDMATQDTQIVRLDEPILYSESEPLVRNIDRHVQLSYPFYLFDEKSFEIDDNGHPWWVCPVQKRTIGLFGGTTISRVVLCDAVTGETQDMPIEECPQWVDRAYPAELLVQQYNWSGRYKNGWLNSWLGQSGVVQTTPGNEHSIGYNYIAKDDDVWVYTGVTSATADNSIVGFVLVNQRTAESHFYSVAGATEESAMQSAEGQVQNLHYRATFPLLLNINAQPTYFMALKDDAGLVKQYAMLDIQRYQNVAIGDSVANCQKSYKQLLAANGEAEQLDVEGLKTAKGTIKTISQAVIENNSHFYVVLKDDSNIYDCVLPGLLDIVAYAPGDTIELKYSPDKPTSPVFEIVGKTSEKEEKESVEAAEDK